MTRIAVFVLLAGQIGESDCEEIGDGFLAQPSNALSSGAYVLFGLWLVVRALRNRGEELATEVVYGLTLASVGVGSVLFHGPMPAGSRLAHDLTIAAVFAVVLVRAVGKLLEWSNVAVIAGIAALTTVVGVLMAVAPDAGNIATGAVAVTAIGLQVYLYRQGIRGAFTGRLVRWFVAIVVVLSIAGIVNVLGRTDAPLCDPDSLYQGHAVWHVLTAAAFAMFGFISFPSPQGRDEALR